MEKYEAIKPLYEFLIVPKNSKKHLVNDNSSWTMEKFMHQEVKRTTRVAMGLFDMLL
jgi:hypothetical protein